MSDKEILRRLGYLYNECANSDINKKRMELHTAINDLKPVRPILLLDEFPWHELNFDDSLTLQCTDEKNRGLEGHIRRKLMQWKHFSGDMILEPYITVTKKISGDDMGVHSDSIKLKTDSKSDISSQHYINLFQSEEDIEKLHNVNIVYNEKETLESLERVSNIVGDVVPVQLRGVPTGYYLSNKTWDIIATYMGVNDLLINMVAEPEFMHRLVQKLNDICNDRFEQFEKLNLLDENALYCHAASALSSELKNTPITDGKPTLKNVWGRGLAQILTSVSPEMHDEFDIAYMMKSMEPFGLVYYGCCEALDNKIDIVRKIPNLRKICISPWADMNRSAEQIGDKYVMCAKPNPATIGLPNLDITTAKKELEEMINAAKDNNCPLEIVMKDISTVGYNPQTLIDWTNLAMSMIN